MQTRGGMLATKAMVRPRSSGCSILRLLLLGRHHRPQFQDRGCDLAGRQAAGAQTVDAFVHVERMGQRQHRVLGGGVGRARHFRDVTSGPGRDVDDAAVFLLAHRRQHRAHAIQHAVEIDLDQFVPAFQLHVGPAALRHIDAGAVDQQIDAAMLARICSAALLTSAFLLTSSAIASALPPLLVILATTPSSASLRRPETTTVQPSAASASAPASPMPLPPPVTQATRFPLFDMQTVSVAL